MPNPSSFIVFEQNADPFIVCAVANNSASILDYIISPCSPTFKLAGAFESMTIYEDVDLPLSIWLPASRQKMMLA